MKKLLAALMVVAMLALTACNHDPGSGVIERKSYSPAYTWFQSVCTMQSKYGCMAHILVPYYVPAEWEFYLRKDSEHSGWHEVDQAEYDRYQIGQTYA